MYASISASVPMIAAFSVTVFLTLLVAWISLLIRGRLNPKHGQPTEVQASLFKEKLRYVTTGPVAEFVVLMGTIAFVVVVFWLLLTR